MEKTRRIRKEDMLAQTEDHLAADPVCHSLRETALSRKVKPINYDKGFFLEYDTEGKALTNAAQVLIDISRVLDMPPQEIAYNHRPLERERVAGIKRVIEESYAGHGQWRKPDLIVAPIVPPPPGSGGKAQRVKPQDFQISRVSTYHWYAVAGQHTAAAARELLRVSQLAIDKGFHKWRVRPVYFDNDELKGYSHIATEENTKELKGLSSSQRGSVASIRQLWLEMGKPEAVYGIAGESDVGRQKKKESFEDFQRAAMRMTNNRVYWEMTTCGVDHDSEWSNILRPFLALAETTDKVWALVQKFNDEWERGNIAESDVIKPISKRGVPGIATREGPGTQDVKEGKILVHFVRGTDGSHHFIAVPEPQLTAWRAFRSMSMEEKEYAFLRILVGEVMITQAPKGRGGLRFPTGVQDDIKRDRYMLCMINFMLFDKQPEDWNDHTFLGLQEVLDRFAHKGLDRKTWDERRKEIPLDLVKMMPMRLGGMTEKSQGGHTKTESWSKRMRADFKAFVYRLLDKTTTLEIETSHVRTNQLCIKWKDRQMSTSLSPVRIHLLDVIIGSSKVAKATRNFPTHFVWLDICGAGQMDSWTEEQFHLLQAFMNLYCGNFWTLVLLVPFHAEGMVLRQNTVRVTTTDITDTMGAIKARVKYGEMTTTGKHHKVSKDLDKLREQEPRVFIRNVVDEKFPQAEFADGDLAGGKNLVYGSREKCGELTMEMYASTFDDAAPFDDGDSDEQSQSERLHIPQPRSLLAPEDMTSDCTINVEADNCSDNGGKVMQLAPGDPLPAHASLSTLKPVFYGKAHVFTPEEKWGHDIIWHPYKFQPCVSHRQWAYAFANNDGEWSLTEWMGRSAFQDHACDEIKRRLQFMNSNASIKLIKQRCKELYDSLLHLGQLEFFAEFYDLEKSPSRLPSDTWVLPTISGGQAIHKDNDDMAENAIHKDNDDMAENVVEENQMLNPRNHEGCKESLHQSDIIERGQEFGEEHAEFENSNDERMDNNNNENTDEEADKEDDVYELNEITDDEKDDEGGFEAVECEHGSGGLSQVLPESQLQETSKSSFRNDIDPSCRRQAEAIVINDEVNNNDEDGIHNVAEGIVFGIPTIEDGSVDDEVVKSSITDGART
ncbi:hypothetical protein CBR_g3860 [Chara braunii]|uniref:Uncharacterized protein n=1 Tax=Chara braunii TaxID=69332 RepID=A0A388KGH1_CHABU|nr:hypothetical protein CBR_g3860 [Chara braunii]|eukprot:GBG69160.1 hypothetical protein CBR_g3860 [Chara braunii]